MSCYEKIPRATVQTGLVGWGVAGEGNRVLIRRCCSSAAGVESGLDQSGRVDVREVDELGW